MKRMLGIFSASLLLLAVMTTLTACSDSDDDNRCYFTFGVENYQVSGSSADMEEVQNYLNSVYSAYTRALGLSDNTIIVDGDYKTLKANMKAAFDSAQLPAALQTAASYSFTIALRGCKLSDNVTELEKMDLVASRTFSN